MPTDHSDPLAHVAQHDEPDAMEQARRDAGGAIRDIGHALIGHTAPIELVRRVTATLDELTAALVTNPLRSRADAEPPTEWGEPPADGEVMWSYDERPISGRASPWGLDLVVHRDGDEAVATCTLRAAHEGAPGRSHGGVVAALFDDVYGFVLTLIAEPGFTGEICVRYEAGVPIGRELQCRVRLAERDGRKLRMTGELTDAGTVVARSWATFITVDVERMRASLGSP